MELTANELTTIRNALNTEIADLVRLARYAAAKEIADLRDRVQAELDKTTA